MWFMTYIIQYLGQVRDFFYDAYLEVRGWVWPFHYLSTPLYQIYSAFVYITYYAQSLDDWLVWSQDLVQNILDWNTIWSYILSYVPNLQTMSAWFSNWASYVVTMVEAWWDQAQYTVRAWIDQAVGGLEDIAGTWSTFWNDIWPDLLTTVNSLKSGWSDFWTYTLPTLISSSGLATWWAGRISEVAQLIDSAFNARSGLWAGWQEMRASVVTFFQDPLEWLWERFADWFLGPEG